MTGIKYRTRAMRYVLHGLSTICRMHVTRHVDRHAVLRIGCTDTGSDSAPIPLVQTTIVCLGGEAWYSQYVNKSANKFSGRISPLPASQ